MLTYMSLPPLHLSAFSHSPGIQPSLYWVIPMTPQAGRPPALPVFLLSSWPPFPRSSVPACTTMVRPMTLWGPMSLTSLSVNEPLPLPCPSVSKLPRSPTWRSLSSGAPCSLPSGLTVYAELEAAPIQCWMVGYSLLTVGTGARAAVCVIAEGVDVHASLCVRIVAGDIVGDLGL